MSSLNITEFNDIVIFKDFFVKKFQKHNNMFLKNMKKKIVLTK